MDMLSSANNVILDTRTSVDRFTNSLDDLAGSVGTAAFAVLVAGAFALSAGLGNASLFALGRIDEHFFQPIISRISESESWSDFFSGLTSAFDESGAEVTSRVVRSLSAAYAKYQEGRRRRSL